MHAPSSADSSTLAKAILGEGKEQECQLTALFPTHPFLSDAQDGSVHTKNGVAMRLKVYQDEALCSVKLLVPHFKLASGIARSLKELLKFLNDPESVTQDNSSIAHMTSWGHFLQHDFACENSYFI